jgi:hypothetical protein
MGDAVFVQVVRCGEPVAAAPCADINVSKVRSVAEAIKADGGSAAAYELDVSSRSAWQELVSSLGSSNARIDMHSYLARLRNRRMKSIACRSAPAVSAPMTETWPRYAIALMDCARVPGPPTSTIWSIPRPWVSFFHHRRLLRARGARHSLGDRATRMARTERLASAQRRGGARALGALRPVADLRLRTRQLQPALLMPRPRCAGDHTAERGAFHPPA